MGTKPTTTTATATATGIFNSVTLCVIVAGTLTAFAPRIAEAVQPGNQDLIDANTVKQLVKDCQVEKNGQVPVLSDVPFLGTIIDATFDAISGGAKRRNAKENECIAAHVEGRRAENEREAERGMDAKRARCARACFPTDEWADYCREPGVPETPLCPQSASSSSSSSLYPKR